MPNDPNAPAPPANSAAPLGNEPVGGGAAAPASGAPNAVNSPAPVAGGVGGGAAAGGAAPVSDEMSREDLVKEVATLSQRLTRATSGYSELQSALERSNQQLQELRKTQSASVQAQLPKTKEEMVAVLQDPENKFFPLLSNLVQAELAKAGIGGNPSTPAAAPQNDQQFFADNLSRVSAVRDIVSFAQQSGMDESAVVQFMVEFGLQVDPASQKVVQLPFQWASSPQAAVKMAKDIIRGRMAPAMASRTIQAAAEAGQRAADEQIRSQLPPGSSPSPGAIAPGGSGDSESQRFLAWLGASPDDALKMG